MKRKVIKQANQAYTITLPINWVRENNIDKHLELDIEVQERSLIITNKEDIKHTTAKINTTDLSKRDTFRQINALYAKGIDEIEITSNQCTSEITSCLGNTIGYALTCHKNNKFTIKDIGGTNHENIDEIFKRTFQMLLSFYTSAIDDIWGKQTETLTNLQARDTEINKFSLYLQRAINKMSYPNQTNGRALFTYAFELEKIGDEIMRLWRTNIKYKFSTTNETKKLSQDSLKILEKAFDSYYSFNQKQQEEIFDRRNKLRDKSLKIKANPTTTRAIRHITKIAEDATDLSHLTLMIKL